MSHIQRTHQQNKTKKVRQNDWVCSLCNNYNYSFRVSCKLSFYSGNRCHIQLRNNNINKDLQDSRNFTKLAEHLE